MKKASHHSEEAKEKNRQAHLGKKLSKEHKEKISKSLKGKHPKNIGLLVRGGKRTRFEKGKIPEGSKLFLKGHRTWNKGKHIQNNDALKRWRENGGNVWNKGKEGLQIAWNKGIKGGKSHSWKGGIQFEPYGIEFNKELKEQIRERDDFTCQECNYSEKELGYTLSVHHIDYDKKNNKLNNLISLCRSCHSQTNFGRQDWTNYLREKII